MPSEMPTLKFGYSIGGGFDQMKFEKTHSEKIDDHRNSYSKTMKSKVEDAENSRRHSKFRPEGLDIKGKASLFDTHN